MNFPTEDYITTITRNEMIQLAARLLARADSILFKDQPQQVSDLRLAVRIILGKVADMGDNKSVTTPSGK